MSVEVPFAEGSYIIEKGYLVTPRYRAVELTDGILEVQKDPRGVRVLHGRAFVLNRLMVALLEEETDLDLLLDLGEGFRYWLRNPNIQAGKVFETRTRSLLHFSPTRPLEPISDGNYLKIRENRLQLHFPDGD